MTRGSLVLRLDGIMRANQRVYWQQPLF